MMAVIVIDALHCVIACNLFVPVDLFSYLFSYFLIFCISLRFGFINTWMGCGYKSPSTEVDAVRSLFI